VGRLVARVVSAPAARRRAASPPCRPPRVRQPRGPPRGRSPSGVERSIPLGLLTVAGRRYLGHPSGDTAWTLNVRAAASATIEAAGIPRQRIRPVLIGPGSERDAVVRATFRQHPFPGNAMYRLSGRHVAAAGVFFRIEPLDASHASDGGTP